MQSKRFTKEDLACFNIDRQIFWNFWSRKIAVWAGFLFLSSLLFKKQNKKPSNLKTNQPEKKSKQKPQQTPFQNMVMSETKCWQQFYDMWGVPEEAAMKPLHKKKACGEGGKYILQVRLEQPGAWCSCSDIFFHTARAVVCPGSLPGH